MYRIRIENLEELKEGKTITYLSELTGVPRTYLNSILSGKILIEEDVIKKILIPICKESFKLNEKLETYGIETMIEHFFRRIA